MPAALRESLQYPSSEEEGYSKRQEAFIAVKRKLRETRRRTPKRVRLCRTLTMQAEQQIRFGLHRLDPQTGQA